MLRRFFIALLAALGAVTASAANRPNILWLTAEDIGPNLGCYGDTYAVTPNLDAFAARSQIFLKAWSNAPVCAPARTTIISGMYPPSTGSEHMRSSVPLPEEVKMYPQLLREAGYYCTNNAKEDYNLQKNKAADGSDAVWDESSKKAHWRNRPADKPFFAVFNFEKTHESQIRKPGHQLVHDPAKAVIPPYHPDLPEVRHDWAQYADNITAMDQLFAARLKELEDAGLAEDTIVFFYGDHGAGMPRHKRWPYHSGLRVPLIVHFPQKWRHLAPKGYGPGGKSEELVSFVDLAPTLLSIIGEAAPAFMQGRAFCGAHAKPAPEYLYGFRGRMDERLDLVRSITDGRYVYLRQYMPHLSYGQHLSYMMQMPTARVWKAVVEEGRATPEQALFWQPTKPFEELYDLQSDVWEVHNLASSPEHAEVLHCLRAAHEKQMLATRDLGFIPEAERLAASGARAPRDAFATEEALPFNDVFRMAQLASNTSITDASGCAAGLTHANASVRYWAALGLHIRGESSVKPAREALLKSLQDPSVSVRIVAATALATHGAPEDLAPALDVLLTAADAEKSGNAAAVEALNALSFLVPKLGGVKDRIQALPSNAPGTVPRLKEYVGRLKEKLFSDLGLKATTTPGQD